MRQYVVRKSVWFCVGDVVGVKVLIVIKSE